MTGALAVSAYTMHSDARKASKPGNEDPRTFDRDELSIIRIHNLGIQPRSDTLMGVRTMLRIGEKRANSSWASIARHANAVEHLAGDLRRVTNSRSLPNLDARHTPVVEEWFIEKFIVPTLVGFISYPGGSDADHGQRGSMSFTAPLHLFALRQGMARSSQRWYLLGRPSSVAEDSLRRWSVDGEI